MTTSLRDRLRAAVLCTGGFSNLSTTELTAGSTLAVPADVSARLLKTGRVRVLLLTDDDAVAAETALDDAYEAGYRRMPEDVSLVTATLPLTAVAAGGWE